MSEKAALDVQTWGLGATEAEQTFQGTCARLSFPCPSLLRHGPPQRPGMFGHPEANGREASGGAWRWEPALAVEACGR